jgi:ubiquitin C-terminal hydrolase
MDLTKYKDKGYTGMINLGNTCFINSCLQILNHTYELEFILTKVKPGKYKKAVDKIIFEEWIDLQKLMWSHNGIVSPAKFFKNFQKVAKLKCIEIFSGWAQNDMSEFLLFMVESLHNSISRKVLLEIDTDQVNVSDKKALACYKLVQDFYKNEYSEIVDLFYGISISEIISHDFKETFSTKPELFFILDLPIKSSHDTDKVDLYDCLDEFVKPEFIGGDNKWYHEDRKEYLEIQKKISFWSFPKIFVITLKRFSSCGSEKIYDFVDFPLTNFDVSKYASGNNPIQYIYNLYAVCNHYGEVQGGHYNACVMNSNKEWILYDDTVCQKIQIDDIITSDAYCLFYRRQLL